MINPIIFYIYEVFKNGYLHKKKVKLGGKPLPINRRNPCKVRTFKPRLSNQRVDCLVCVFFKITNISNSLGSEDLSKGIQNS